MKQLFVVCLLISMSLLLFGCGKQTTSLGETDKQGDTKTTMHQLLEEGKPVTCTFQKVSADGATFSGTVWIKNKTTMRHQAVGTFESQTIEMNLLVLGNDVYSWVNGDHKKGYTMKTTPKNEEDEGWLGKQKEMDEAMDFVCKKGVKKNLFSLPTDITFETLE